MSSDSAPPALVPRAIVTGHGELAQGMLSAVEVVSGRQAVFVPLSNRDLDRAGLESTLRDALAGSGARVVFTDLPGGSWTLAARRLQREFPDLVIVTGTSLPALLHFAFSSDSPADSARHAAEKGRAALNPVEPPGAVGT